MLNKLREKRAALKAALEALVNTAEGESRSLNDAENAEFDATMAEIRALDERIAELQEAEVREAAANAHRVEIAAPKVAFGESVRSEPNPVYRPDNGHEVSYFRDMVDAKLGGNRAAFERLARSQETRANDMTSVTGAGGEFAPPLWAVEDYIKLARAGRVAADRLNHEVLPDGVSSINLPAVSTGSATGVQQTQGTAVTDTAMTTTSVSSGITTISGKQIVSLQLLRQSGIPFDRVILGDLAADYAKQLDTQVLAGSGANGQLKGLDSAAGNAVTFTTTQPVVVSTTTANSFYYQVVSAINKIQTGRYMAPNAIIMHPRRWNWILALGVDGQNRPLVVPSTPVFNGIAAGDSGAPTEGLVGNLLGVPVYVDANVSTAANSTTNQDEVYVLRTDDSWLYETALESTSFDATYADQASILFRVLGFSALVHRYGKSISTIKGSGLVDPGL